MERVEKGTQEDPVQPSLSKNKLRKLRRWEKAVERRKAKRKAERDKRKVCAREAAKNVDADVPSKRDKKEAIVSRMKSAVDVAPKVAVDLQYGGLMTPKETTHLAIQLGRLYGSNRTSEKPLHVFFVNLDKSSDMFRVCCEKNSGFENYIVTMSDKDVCDIVGKDDVVYLSPDSPNVLTCLDPSKVYVIGGLVDESVQKETSLNVAKQKGVATASLPIEQNCVRASEGTFKKILTVNQVFDVLLNYYTHQNWAKAFESALPKKIGFIPQIESTPE